MRCKLGYHDFRLAWEGPWSLQAKLSTRIGDPPASKFSDRYIVRYDRCSRCQKVRKSIHYTLDTSLEAELRRVMGE